MNAKKDASSLGPSTEIRKGDLPRFTSIYLDLPRFTLIGPEQQLSTSKETGEELRT